jgi:hypothetical protein
MIERFVWSDWRLSRATQIGNLSLIGKTLESPLAERHEPRRILLLAQLARESGNDDAVGLGFAAQPRGKLHRRAKQVAMVLDRFARVDADPNAQGLGRVGVVSGKSPLDIGGGSHRVLYLVEGGHNAVAGMLDLAPAVRLSPRRTSASCTRTGSSAALSPRRAVISVEPTMSVNMTARSPASTAGAAAPGVAHGSPMRPRKASTAARSTGMMALGISPCEPAQVMAVHENRHEISHGRRTHERRRRGASQSRFRRRYDRSAPGRSHCAEAHRRDVDIQDRHGVKYMAYWFDENNGAAFCLVHAPDPATAERVHREGVRSSSRQRAR